MPLLFSWIRWLKRLVSYKDCLTIFEMWTSRSLSRTLGRSNCWTVTLHFGKDMQMEIVKTITWVPGINSEMPGPDTRGSNPGDGKKLFSRSWGLQITHPTPIPTDRIFPRLSFQPTRTAKWRGSEFHSPYTLHSARLWHTGKLNDYKIIGNSHNGKQTTATAYHVTLTTSQRLSQYLG